MEICEMRVRGKNNKLYTVHAVANQDRLFEGYSDLLKKYNGYVVKSLHDLKNINNKTIFFIIETGVYYVVTHKTMDECMSELLEKYKNDK